MVVEIRWAVGLAGGGLSAHSISLLVTDVAGAIVLGIVFPVHYLIRGFEIVIIPLLSLIIFQLRHPGIECQRTDVIHTSNFINI